MRYGFSASGACGASVNFEAQVAAFALRHWNRGSYSGSPWAGTASAGASGSNSLTEATNPPGTAPIWGFTAANFDGTNDTLNTGAALSTYYTTTAQYGWALVQLDAINTNDANWGLNDAIIMSNGTLQWGIILRNASGTLTVEHKAETGSTRTASTSIALSTPQLVQWTHNGTNIRIRVNRNSWASGTGGTLTSLAAAGAVGSGGAGGQFMDGILQEIAFTESTLSDANFDTVCNYVEQRYAITLA